jgi:hypothetical protein
MNYISKKDTIIYLLGLSGIVLALAFMISPNNNNMVLAQQNNTNTTTSSSNGASGMMTPNILQQNPYSMTGSSGAQNQSWTGSISLFSPIIDAFKSKIHTTLNDASTTAINAVSGGGTGAGSNSSAAAAAVAAFIHPENGFLVYDVFVLDPSNNIHRVIVDPGNGRLLSNQPMSVMDMMTMAHPSMGMMGMGPPNMMMGPPPQASPLAMDMMMGSPFPPHSMMMGGGPPGMGMMMGGQHKGWP